MRISPKELSRHEHSATFGFSFLSGKQKISLEKKLRTRTKAWKENRYKIKTPTLSTYYSIFFTFSLVRKLTIIVNVL